MERNYMLEVLLIAIKQIISIVLSIVLNRL